MTIQKRFLTHTYPSSGTSVHTVAKKNYLRIFIELNLKYKVCHVVILGRNVPSPL
jgi:hypothetical protein